MSQRVLRDGGGINRTIEMYSYNNFIFSDVLGVEVLSNDPNAFKCNISYQSAFNCMPVLSCKWILRYINYL
jgi:hypothetical protein